MGGRIDSLRNESGNIKSSDPLMSFIYELLRDHMTCAKVEEIVSNIVTESGKEIIYTNGWLAQYADNLANLIRNADKIKKEYNLDKVWKEFEEHGDTIEDGKEINSNNADEFKDDIDESAIAGLEESKAALQAMITNGQISEKDANDIRNEISELLNKPIDASTQDEELNEV